MTGEILTNFQQFVDIFPIKIFRLVSYLYEMNSYIGIRQFLLVKLFPTPRANSSSSATSRSTCLESASNSSSSTSRSSAVSLLSVLKAPTVSDLSRKRKIARNPAPVEKRRARASGGSLMQQLCLIGPMLLRRFWPFNLPQLLQRECFHC